MLGHPSPYTAKKVHRSLNGAAKEFIGKSPLLFLSTVDQSGQPTVSPKGDAPGFVRVESPTTLFIPERQGNRLLMTLQNLLANEHIGLLFAVPRTTETLRVHGKCSLVVDDDLCQSFASGGRAALLILRIEVTECFFHCGKAFIRSDVWNPASWPPPAAISFGREICADPETAEFPPCHLEPNKNLFREYEPQSGLFRTFAATPPSPEGILKFVNKYGHLGDELADLPYDLDEPEFESKDDEAKWSIEANRLVDLFDSLRHWIQAIKEMRDCVKNLDEQKGKADGLMLEKILDTVNHQLIGSRFRFAFGKDRRPSGFIMHVVPSNLLGALWLQLGQTIVENKKVRSCTACQKWFELTPAKNRTSRTHCSEACRSRAYRIRKEQAVRMADNGKNIGEIAHVLGSTIGTVKTWLKQRTKQS